MRAWTVSSNFSKLNRSQKFRLFQGKWSHSKVHHYNAEGKASTGEVRSEFTWQWPTCGPRPVASDWVFLCLKGARDLRVQSSLSTSIWQCIPAGLDSELSRSYASRIIPTPRRSVTVMETLGWSHYVCRGMCLAGMLLCGTDPWQQFSPCVCQVAVQCTEFQDGSKAQLLLYSTLAFLHPQLLFSAFCLSPPRFKLFFFFRKSYLCLF